MSNVEINFNGEKIASHAIETNKLNIDTYWDNRELEHKKHLFSFPYEIPTTPYEANIPHINFNDKFNNVYVVEYDKDPVIANLTPFCCDTACCWDVAILECRRINHVYNELISTGFMVHIYRNNVLFKTLFAITRTEGAEKADKFIDCVNRDYAFVNNKNWEDSIINKKVLYEDKIYTIKHVMDDFKASIVDESGVCTVIDIDCLKFDNN